MAYKIYDDGAVLRIDKDGAVLLVSKSQIKTIDTIAGGTVRIAIGGRAIKKCFY